MRKINLIWFLFILFFSKVSLSHNVSTLVEKVKIRNNANFVLTVTGQSRFQIEPKQRCEFSTILSNYLFFNGIDKYIGAIYVENEKYKAFFDIDKKVCELLHKGAWFEINCNGMYEEINLILCYKFNKAGINFYWSFYSNEEVKKFNES